MTTWNEPTDIEIEYHNGVYKGAPRDAWLSCLAAGVQRLDPAARGKADTDEIVALAEDVK